jgi:hypothetical protein
MEQGLDIEYEQLLDPELTRLFVFLAISAFHDHVRPMGEWDADHPVHMVHINTADVVPRERVIK